MHPHNQNLHTNKAGITIIKLFESCRLTAYLCPACKPTIGWGHTGPDVTQEDVKNHKTITEKEAAYLLVKDLIAAENTVKLKVTVPLTSNQFSALTSFVYNVGPTTFQNSNSVLSVLNHGHYDKVPSGLRKYVYGDPNKA